MMKKKLGMIMTAVAVSSLMLAGCGKEKGGNTESTSASETTTEITEETSSEEETTTVDSDWDQRYPEAHEEPGEVYTAKELYGREYDNLQFSLDGVLYGADEYLEVTKEKFNTESTKYRDLYTADLEALPFTCVYRNDENSIYPDMDQEELTELAKSCAKVAEQFGILYWTHDANGSVFGESYGWPLEDYVYEDNVTYGDAREYVEPILITELKCDHVCLMNTDDGTPVATVYFFGYGMLDDTQIAVEGDEWYSDVLVKRSIYLIYENDEWEVCNTAETNSDLLDKEYRILEDDSCYYWISKKSSVEEGTFVSIVGDASDDVNVETR